MCEDLETTGENIHVFEHMLAQTLPYARPIYGQAFTFYLIQNVRGSFCLRASLFKTTLGFGLHICWTYKYTYQLIFVKRILIIYDVATFIATEYVRSSGTIKPHTNVFGFFPVFLRSRAHLHSKSSLLQIRVSVVKQFYT